MIHHDESEKKRQRVYSKAKQWVGGSVGLSVCRSRATIKEGRENIQVLGLPGPIIYHGDSPAHPRQFSLLVHRRVSPVSMCTQCWIRTVLLDRYSCTPVSRALPTPNQIISKLHISLIQSVASAKILFGKLTIIRIFSVRKIFQLLYVRTFTRLMVEGRYWLGWFL